MSGQQQPPFGNHQNLYTSQLPPPPPRSYGHQASADSTTRQLHAPLSAYPPTSGMYMSDQRQSNLGPPKMPPHPLMTAPPSIPPPPSFASSAGTYIPGQSGQPLYNTQPTASLPLPPPPPPLPLDALSQNRAPGSYGPPTAGLQQHLPYQNQPQYSQGTLPPPPPPPSTFQSTISSAASVDNRESRNGANHDGHNIGLSSSSSDGEKYSRVTNGNSQPGSSSSQSAAPSKPASSKGKSNSRIDPSQMPRPQRPPTDIHFHTRSGSGRRLPPLANAGFQSIDTGNCSPRHLRMTTCAPATTKDLQTLVGIPLGFVTTPFANPENGEDPVPVVDMGGAPPRCTRCNGYVNPSVTWQKEGNAWGCNLCGMSNPVPPWYFSSLDGVGLRLDRSSRLELSLGSVDFCVPDEYCYRPPQEPIYVFAIDISLHAVSSGVTDAGLKAVAGCLQHLPGGDAAKVGIITFDQQVHFYQVREESAEPIRVLVSDSEDPVAALPANALLLSVHSRMAGLELLLSRIPELIPGLQARDVYSTGGGPGGSAAAGMGAAGAGAGGAGGGVGGTFPPRGAGQPPSSVAAPAGSRNPYFAEPKCQSCPVAAIRAVQQALETTGGRVYVITSSQVGVGYGKIRNREAIAAYGKEAELALYAPLDFVVGQAKAAEDKEMLATYAALTEACLRSYVCVNVLLCVDGDEFRDVALMSEPCEKTGGTLYFMTGSMTIEQNASRLAQQLSYATEACCGSEAILKVRTSMGLRLQSIFGKGMFKNVQEELELVGVDCDTSFAVALQHDAAVKDEDRMHIQLAVLYTTPDKKRRVRVHNMCILASGNATIIFRHADLDAVATYMTKLAMNKALRQQLSGTADTCPRTYLHNQLIEILHKYRVQCSSHSPRGQLILPESLKLLPLYVLGMLKHPSLILNTAHDPVTSPSSVGAAFGKLHVRGHERAFELRRMLSLPVRETINTLYPRMYALHSILDDEELPTVFTGKGSPSSPPGGGSADGAQGRIMHSRYPLKLPRSLSVTSEVFESDGIYLLDDGSHLWLYVGRSVPQADIEDWFGLHPHQRPHSVSFRAGSEAAMKMAVVVETIKFYSAYKQELRVLWADEPSSPGFSRFDTRLVEDSLHGDMSYVDFLCKLHSKIQSK